jgi:LPXTG-motif cell wall-anchored protein
MKNNRIPRNIALVSGAGLAVVPMAFAATPSFAATDCGEGTEVSAGICEKAFTTAGDYTFAVPASVSKMSAVLVGGGQGGGTDIYGPGSFLAYGGGGGGVLFVDSVNISAPISITVGAGGANDYSKGGDSTIGAATAGGGGVLGSQSGAPQDSPGFTFDDGASGVDYGSGGGAGGTPTTCASGAGLTASSAAAGSSLFPALLGEPEFGQGGSCSGIVLLGAPVAGKGGDVFTDGASPSAVAGTDGAVILRWSPALPDTGMNAQTWMIGAGVATVAAGAVLASGALRLRRQGRHSN